MKYKTEDVMVSIISGLIDVGIRPMVNSAPLTNVGHIHINNVNEDETVGLYVVASAYELEKKMPLAVGRTGTAEPMLDKFNVLPFPVRSVHELVVALVASQHATGLADGV